MAKKKETNNAPAKAQNKAPEKPKAKAQPKSNSKKEVTELEKSYESITGKKPQEKSGSKGRVAAIIAGSVFLVITAAVLVLIYLFPWLIQFGKISANVHVAGVDVSGMLSQQAVIAVYQSIGESYNENTLVFTAGDQTVEIPASLSGVQLDVPGAVAAACKLTEDTGHMDLTPYLTINDSAVKAALSTILEENQTTLKQSTYEIVGEFDPSAGTVDMELVITMGQAGINSDTQSLYEAVLAAYSENRFSVDYVLQIVEPKPLNLQSIAKEHSVDPIDAVMDMETFVVSDHGYGCTFNPESASELVDAANYNEVVNIPFVIIEPENTKEEVSSILYRDELASYTARAGSRPYTRDINLRLSCEKINGTVLLPGQVFDYNKALGKRTPENGWKKADGYLGGQTVSEYGGGICQASSSLYYCTLIADLEIVTRKNHSFVSSYMPMGMDATVSWGGPDFRFKNNTEYPIRIEATADKGNVTVKLIGTDTKDYYVKMQYAVLSTTNYETVYEEMTEAEAAAQGKKDGEEITSPYTGYKVITYKCKYSKETDALISKEEEELSIYKKRDRVLVKIVEEEIPTDTATPTTPETTSPQETTSPVIPPESTSPDLGGSGAVDPDV